AVGAIPHATTLLVDRPLALTNQSSHRLQQMRLQMVANREGAVVLRPHSFIAIQNSLSNTGNEFGHGVFVVACNARRNGEHDRSERGGTSLQVLKAFVGDDLTDHRGHLGFYPGPLRPWLWLPRDVVVLEPMIAQTSEESRIAPSRFEFVTAFDAFSRGLDAGRRCTYAAKLLMTDMYISLNSSSAPPATGRERLQCRLARLAYRAALR
ncbi:hypothetical protein CCACVL1_01295, partial [Corchorus capsularis]